MARMYPTRIWMLFYVSVTDSLQQLLVVNNLLEFVIDGQMLCHVSESQLLTDHFLAAIITFDPKYTLPPSIDLSNALFVALFPS